MDRGQWIVDSGQWTVDSGQWTVDRVRWTVQYLCKLLAGEAAEVTGGVIPGDGSLAQPGHNRESENEK